MELSTQTHGLVGARVGARGQRRGWFPAAGSGRAQVAAPPARNEADVWTAAQLEHLWDRHGGSVYALACALLGDEAAAARAVTLAMIDLALATRSESPENALRSLTRHVYWRSQEVTVQPAGTTHLPPVMAWLGQLAQLQRACLALCVFGGHSHREAAELLGVQPSTVADLLTAGLRELGHLAAGGSTTSA